MVDRDLQSSTVSFEEAALGGSLQAEPVVVIHVGTIWAYPWLQIDIYLLDLFVTISFKGSYALFIYAFLLLYEHYCTHLKHYFKH